jgi:hypothetical protein
VSDGGDLHGSGIILLNFNEKNPFFTFCLCYSFYSTCKVLLGSSLGLSFSFPLLLDLLWSVVARFESERVAVFLSRDLRSPFPSSLLGFYFCALSP